MSKEVPLVLLSKECFYEYHEFNDWYKYTEKVESRDCFICGYSEYRKIINSKNDEKNMNDNLTFEDAISNGMTWAKIIMFWKPNATKDEVEEIFNQMYGLSYNDAVIGRRESVTTQMIFFFFLYVYFKELNHNK